ncbi:hypothetical protein ACF068_06100 [Streptomyces sp. NPDC016309]|uniref:hypothetical protein n=1 Tax=Streptomyces sp. NPDC016309 TaxID=3364965 RepID=UPI0036F7B886
MNLRATVIAAATGVLLAAGTATAHAAAEPAPGAGTGTGTGANAGSDGVAIVKRDRLTPSSVVDYVLDTEAT